MDSGGVMDSGGLMDCGSASVAGGSCGMSALPKLSKQAFQPKEIFFPRRPFGKTRVAYHSFQRVAQQVEVAPLRSKQRQSIFLYVCWSHSSR